MTRIRICHITCKACGSHLLSCRDCHVDRFYPTCNCGTRAVTCHSFGCGHTGRPQRIPGMDVTAEYAEHKAAQDEEARRMEAAEAGITIQEDVRY